MAIKEIKSLNNGLGEYVREFICDLASDLADMPKAINNVAIGSTVLCLENKTKYILSVGDIWKQFETPKADLVGGKVPTEQLPSYVDDVLEFNTLADFPATGESGKIYVVKDTNKIYRWGGSEYVPIGNDLALGETSSTAYRGDKGKIAYDHSQLVADNPHNTTKAMIGLGNVDNTSDLNKPISTATQNALDGIEALLEDNNQELSLKADKTYVDTQDELKADKSYVDAQNALKADKTYVDTGLSLKENIVDNNQKLTLKADKTYVDNKLSSKADQATTLAGYGITDAYTKAEVDNRTTAVYRVKGNVPTYASLPSTGQITGDVYNVVDTGINYVWNGTEWDDIGGVEAMATASEDGLMSKEDFVKLQALYTRSDLDNKLTLKADKTYVDSQDALKVDKNANITGATKTKITYDSKGLVTGGADLEESDIPTLSASKITQTTTAKFVSDTEKSTWNGKQDKLVAGDNISIIDNTISASGGGEVSIWRYE